jgi:acetyltransferase-like isoleucine patch superfamily enzyme
MAIYFSDSLKGPEWAATNHKAKQYLQLRGAAFEDYEGFFCTGMPTVTLVNLVDERLQLEDFAGCIYFKKGASLNSYWNSPFPHDLVRITVVKSQHGTGKVLVGATNLNGTSIVSYEKVEIGDGVLFGPNVIIMDCDGHLADRRKAEREGDGPGVIKPVKIGNHAWIGYGAIILKGVTIGDYAVVGAYSVVNKDVAPGTVVGGNPAVTIKTIS